MRRVAATRACQFLWLLLGLTLVVEGRMLPTAGPNLIEACKYTWQLPGTDCWPPIGQSTRCDHFNNEGCAGSPPAVAPTTAGADQREAVMTELEDPDCKPIPGHLPPIHCQNPPVLAAKGAHPHYVWTEVQGDRSDLQIHCEGCLNWPPTVTHHTNQDKMMSSMELEDPDCNPVPGCLPPIRCQNLSMFKAEGGSIQTAKVIEACQYTWQLPGTDCWPPTGMGTNCSRSAVLRLLG